KNASTSSTSIYAIPDPVDEDKDGAKTAKSSGSDNKIAKTGATLDPIQDVKETKETGDKGQQDASKASWTIPPEEPSKDKHSDQAKTGAVKAEGAASIDPGSSWNKKEKNDGGSLASEKKPSDQKTPAEQEPPPIPKGLHAPFQPLPEPPPASSASAPATANRSPRDTSLHKGTTNAAVGTAANS